MSTFRLTTANIGYFQCAVARGCYYFSRPQPHQHQHARPADPLLVTVKNIIGTFARRSTTRHTRHLSLRCFSSAVLPNDNNERRWHEKFEKLKKEIERQQSNDATTARGNGENISKFMPDDPSLRQWVTWQRCLYQKKISGLKSTISDEHIEKLESLPLPVLERKSKPFDETFNDLVEFKERNNGLSPYEMEMSDLTEDEKVLREWCKRQRRQYTIMNQEDCNEKCTLTPERVARLEEIGFLFESFHGAEWEKNYRKLEKFYQHHGHSLVPNKYEADMKLFKWVETQRRQKRLRDDGKYSNITKERIARLEELEFIWSVFDYRWEQKYLLLQAYVELHGHGHTPKKSEREWRTLHRWLKHQRSQYKKFLAGKKTSMTKERMARLNELGVSLE